MIRKATAVWNGSLKEGRASVSTESGAIAKMPFTFGTRFETLKGTNPEELIAAAHAGCFSMALSAQLGTAGMKPDSIETTASLTIEKLDSGWTITKIHLETTAKVPNADKAAFDKAAAAAKEGCPVSKVLKGAEITLDAKLG